MLKASCPLYFMLNFKKSPCLKLINALEYFGLYFFYLIDPYISVKHVQKSCGTYKLFHDVHRRKQRNVTHRLCCPHQDSTVPAGTFSHQYKVYILESTINFACQHLITQVSQQPFQLVFLIICKQTSPYFLSRTSRQKKKICLPTNYRMHINKKNKVNLLIGNTISHRCHVGIHILFINL